MFTFEVCVDNMESVHNAFNGGADRLELCSALSEGGLTPSLGFLKAARKATRPDFPIFSMIRPRGGNFVYTDDEINVMEEDITNLKAVGANGFVFGLLTTENEVDVSNCKRLLNIAKPLPVTFHRAFDEIKSEEDMLKGVETIIELGFSRLLTSGGSKNAEEGIERISRVADQIGERLIIMPGAGICPTNLSTILKATKVREFHGSAKGTGTVTDKAVVQEMKRISCEFLSINK